ncbi:hypothetical protein D3C72_848200 [compost metagenome]
MRGRVGDHQRGELVAHLFDLGAQVGKIDVAVGIRRHHHHVHAGQLGRRGVGAVGRRRDQADVALMLAVGLVVAANCQQAGVFALRARVGLQADVVVAGDFAQRGGQAVDQFVVALALRGGRKRVDQRELGPGDGDHLGRGVQLHGARTQRDHRAVQRQVLVGQLAQVAQHVGFGLHAGENRVLQDGAFARDGCGNAAGGGGVQRVDVEFDVVAFQAGGKHVDQRLQVSDGDGFVQRHRQARAIDAAQVDVLALGGGQDGRGGGAGFQQQRVEERVVHDLHTQLDQFATQDGGAALHALGDAANAFRTMPHGVHAGHHGQQHLRRADVGRGLLAADVLFARLQRQAHRRVALRVFRHADQTAGHVALEGILAGHEAGVRAAKAERHAEALRRTDGDVRAPLARGGQQGQRQQVGGASDHGALRVGGFSQLAVVGHRARAVRVLQQHAKALGQALGLVTHRDFQPQAFGARTHDFDGLRMHVARNEEHRALRLGATASQRHGFGGGGAFVQQRGVGDVQPGQVGDHGLVVQQGFKTALRDLRLIRRVGRVPGGVLKNVAQHDVGRLRAVVPLADVVAKDLVAAGNLLQLGQHVGFAARGRQRQRGLAADLGGHDFVDQGVQAGAANHLEHGGLVGVGRADVAGDEVGMGV